MTELIGLVLQRLPFRARVVPAFTGDAAWRAIRRHRPAVAIVDIEMPGLPGLELTRLIRAQTDLSHTRVIVVTAHRDVDAAVAASGADRLLHKPFSPRDLLGAVGEVLAPAA